MTKTKTTTGDYEVGYGKPPKHTQYKPGESGNKDGRPPGSKGISAAMAAALNERVTVTKNGKRHTMTKWEAACAQMANQAAGGDAKVAKLMIELIHHAEVHDEARAPGSQVGAEDRREADRNLLAALGETLRGLQTEAANDEAV